MHLEAIPQIMDLLQGSTTEVENSEKMVALGIAKFLENPTPTAATCLQAIAEFSRGENYGLEEEEQETETPPLTPHAKIWGEHLARLSEELIKIYDSKGEESEISALGCFDLLVIALDESCIEKIEASILVPLLERAQDCNEEQSLEYFGWIFAEIIKKLGPVAIQYTSKLVNMILKLVENESPECKESGYNLCTEVMQVCTPDRLSDCFSKIAPFVIQHMSCDDSETVMFAARFVGDSALALSALVSEKSDDYMMAAFKAFHNTKLEKDVKITLVRLIGDLALVMTDKFFKYVPAIIKEDDQDFANDLKLGLCDMYTGLCQGIKTNAMLPYLKPIFEFIEKCAEWPLKDEMLFAGLAGLIGDLSQSYKSSIKTELEAITPAAKIIFEGCLDDDVKNWASDLFEKAKSGLLQ